MRRYKALLSTTWWLWLLFVAGGVALTAYVSPVFVITFPLCFATFLYFALVRFDEQGRRREGGNR